LKAHNLPQKNVSKSGLVESGKKKLTKSQKKHKMDLVKGEKKFKWERNGRPKLGDS
jgi:hypothetical protein